MSFYKEKTFFPILNRAYGVWCSKSFLLDKYTKQLYLRENFISKTIFKRLSLGLTSRHPIG